VASRTGLVPLDALATQNKGRGAENAPRPPRYDTSALMPVVARPMISFWICEVPS
jgi:hypothetical protein